MVTDSCRNEPNAPLNDDESKMSPMEMICQRKNPPAAAGNSFQEDTMEEKKEKKLQPVKLPAAAAAGLPKEEPLSLASASSMLSISEEDDGYADLKPAAKSFKVDPDEEKEEEGQDTFEPSPLNRSASYPPKSPASLSPPSSPIPKAPHRAQSMQSSPRTHRRGHSMQSASMGSTSQNKRLSRMGSGDSRASRIQAKLEEAQGGAPGNTRQSNYHRASSSMSSTTSSHSPRNSVVIPPVIHHHRTSSDVIQTAAVNSETVTSPVPQRLSLEERAEQKMREDRERFSSLMRHLDTALPDGAGSEEFYLQEDEMLRAKRSSSQERLSGGPVQYIHDSDDEDDLGVTTRPLTPQKRISSITSLQSKDGDEKKGSIPFEITVTPKLNSVNTAYIAITGVRGKAQMTEGQSSALLSLLIVSLTTQAYSVLAVKNNESTSDAESNSEDNLNSVRDSQHVLPKEIESASQWIWVKCPVEVLDEDSSPQGHQESPLNKLRQVLLEVGQNFISPKASAVHQVVQDYAQKLGRRHSPVRREPSRTSGATASSVGIHSSRRSHVSRASTSTAVSAASTNTVPSTRRASQESVVSENPSTDEGSEQDDALAPLNDDSFVMRDGEDDDYIQPIEFEEEEDLQPGAYAHTGPAFGARPAWARPTWGASTRRQSNDRQALQRDESSGSISMDFLSSQPPSSTSRQNNQASFQNSFSRFGHASFQNSAARFGQWMRGRVVGNAARRSNETNSRRRGNMNSNASVASGTDDGPIKAEIVDEEAMELKLREKVMEEARESAAVADIVDIDDIQKPVWQQKWFWLLICFAVICVAAVIGLVAGVVTAEEDSPDDITNSIPDAPTPSPTEPPPPILEAIASRGFVRCMTEGSGSIETVTRGITLFEMDMCKALAAATLGNSSLVEILNIPMPLRWESLQERTVDVVISRSTHTMGRDVLELSSEKGFAFSAPYLYDGLTFAGKNKFVDCADKLDSYFGDCRLLQVCVTEGSTHLSFLRERLSLRNLVPQSSVADMFAAFSNGECNVIAGEANGLSGKNLEQFGYEGEYIFGNNTFTKEPLAMVTLDTDNEWSLFVDTIMNGLVEAERRGITKSTAHQLPTTIQFGSKYKTMLQKAVQAVGNYGDMYNTWIAPNLPRSSLNQHIQTDDFGCSGSEKGLMYSFPFGSITTDNYLDSMEPGPSLSAIMEQGYLNCGLARARAGFSAFDDSSGQLWSGMDVDLCKGIAASIFGLDDLDEKVKIQSLDSEEDPIQSLLDGRVDVLFGQTAQELRSRRGEVAVSTPYFYHPQLDQAYVLSSRTVDKKWSDYLNWVIMALISEEENPVSLPIVTIFGEDLNLMFRHLLMEIGHYGDVYERNLEPIWPRASTCNKLNLAPSGPQHNPLLIP